VDASGPSKASSLVSFLLKKLEHLNVEKTSAGDIPYGNHFAWRQCDLFGYIASKDGCVVLCESDMKIVFIAIATFNHHDADVRHVAER